MLDLADQSEAEPTETKAMRLAKPPNRCESGLLEVLRKIESDVPSQDRLELALFEMDFLYASFVMPRLETVVLRSDLEPAALTLQIQKLAA